MLPYFIIAVVFIVAFLLYLLFVGDSPVAAFRFPAVDVQWFPSPGGLLAIIFWVGIISFVCVSCGIIKFTQL